MAPKDEHPEDSVQPPRFSVSRRDFLKTAGISSLAAGVAGVAETEAQTPGVRGFRLERPAIIVSSSPHPVQTCKLAWGGRTGHVRTPCLIVGA